MWFAAAAGDHIEGSEAGVADSVTCYQCGQPDIDPESDYPASYCDTTINDNCKKDSKMYNLTCDIMDKTGPSAHWTRLQSRYLLLNYGEATQANGYSSPPPP